MTAPGYRFLDVLQRFAPAGPIPAIMSSDEYRDAIRADFAELPEAPEFADAFFGRSQIVSQLGHSPTAQVWAWQKLLSLLQNADPEKYLRIHKGTPFYFLATAAYVAGDFERALAFMDAAVEEDRRLHGAQWRNVPSGLFFRLQPEEKNQFARQVVKQVTEILQTQLAQVTAIGGPALTLNDLTTKLIEPALDATAELRSVVTALFTFLLEYSSRLSDLRLVPQAAGTGEPAYLHLFKGALLFETLLKTSQVGQPLVAANARATLGDLLCSPAVYHPLGFAAPPQGPGGDTFDDVLQLIEDERAAGHPFHERVIHATWGIRNKTGHSLAWPRKPQPLAYSEAFLLVLGASVLALANLY